MDNHKRMMLYCVLDAVLCNDIEFLDSNALDQFIDDYELNITPKMVRGLKKCSKLEIRSKMRLILES